MPELQQNLETARITLRDYLLNLASHDPHAESWRQQISGTLMGYPVQLLNELQDFFAELADTKYHLAPEKIQPFSCTQTALCLVHLFIKDSPPKEKDPDNLKILYQALYKPGQLLPTIEDFRPEKTDKIEIYEHDVTRIVSVLNKACLLLYIVEKKEEIAQFMQTHPQALKTHPSLSYLLTSTWLEKEVRKIEQVAEKPYEYAHFNLFPSLRGIIPQAENDGENGTFWHSLWQTHLLLPWKLRFGIGRLHARFYDQDYRVEIYYASLPHDYSRRGFSDKLFFYISFWIHLCMAWHIFNNSYMQTIKNDLNTALEYMKGSRSLYSAPTLAFNLTVDILKLLFFPLILATPLLLGITSLPLLLLRALLSKIPGYYVRVSALVLLDAMETLKDLTLLITGILWLSPLIKAAIVLPAALVTLGGFVSMIVLLTTLIALTALGLSPQILAFILGMGGLNKIVDLAFSPLVSLGGVVGILSFPLVLGLLTVPRMVVETAFMLQNFSQWATAYFNAALNPPPPSPSQLLSQGYDPIDDLNLFVKQNPLLLQYEQAIEATLTPSLPLSTPSPAPQLKGLSP